MKYLLFSAMTIMPGMCWSMTEEQAIVNWKLACIAAGGDHFMDFIRVGDVERTPHIIYVCKRESGGAVCQNRSSGLNITFRNGNF